MSAGIYNITLEQGATWEKTITWEDSDGDPIDISTFTAEAVARTIPDADDPLFLLVGGDGLVLGGALGTIVMTLTAEQTAAMTAGRANWEMNLTNGGVITRLLQGTVRITDSVS